ncbi:hypothetical protein COCSADRAFT_212251 [Bipolaris sorokiniana ND90Pr]|uniref:Uncharacterized protein n=1 Tax=Cochliobolus sativus (strain ND90Pr / ATCC 201652) TaxID=665912 RepID=M2TLT3_COCSN|nr:uncharacterized protein COCSADRAFT_212251 [Bipolaris sorokiniana ND90Pr]EMD69637.1 hypothetical protein COCSADRAFT_212251 [Bipolaris sorokiniana ND90Pr]
MDSTPAFSVPASSGTKCASSSPISVFEDHPHSTIDIVVICSYSPLFPGQREQQKDCCERLKAAKLPARILTFICDDRGSESRYGAEEAAILYQSLSSEREASGRTESQIIFISTHRCERWVTLGILVASFTVSPESPVEGINVSSVHSASIVRSTIGVLHFPPSQYTYHQRILETATLVVLQCVGVIVLQCSDPSSGYSISSSQSPLFPIGLFIYIFISDRPHPRTIACWFGIEAILWFFQNSSDIRIIDLVLRYTTLGLFPVYCCFLAGLQFMVNRNDQLQWLFVGMSIVAVITKHWLSSAEFFASPKTLIFTLLLAIIASMVCSACLHCVWRFLSGTRELERQVRLLVHRASKMAPGDLPPLPNIIVENGSVFAALAGRGST